ncbi:MAG: transcription-repair coupling factor [Clostridia bacterium]|nr:transcription-repair coupling factor [Clostridia bacterium]
MKDYFDLQNISPKMKDFYTGVGAGKNGSIFGACESFKIVFSVGFKKQILYITSDFTTASRCFEMFSNLLGERVGIIKPVADNLLYAKNKSVDTLMENALTLGKLANKKLDVVIMPISLALGFYPTKKCIIENTFSVKIGQIVEPRKLAEKLQFAGYKKVELVSAPGEYSIRSDILDVLPLGENIAYRIDFFDREIDDICELDPQNMKKGKKIKDLTFYPCKNIFLNAGEKEKIIKYLKSIDQRKFEDNTAKEEYTKCVNDLIFKLESGDAGFNLDYLMPLIENKASIFDFFDDQVTVIDECKMVYDEGSSYSKEFQSRVKELFSRGTCLSKDDNLIDFADFVKKMSSGKAVVFQKITNTNKFFQPEIILEEKALPVSRYTHSLKDLAKDLKKYDFEGYRNIIFAGNSEDAKHIQRTLKDYGIDYEIKKSSNLSISDDMIIPEEFVSGFVLPAHKILVLGTYDILPRKMQESRLKVQRKNVFSVPKVGDYVVHNFHGIGICEGVTKLSGNFGTKDYVVVRYAGDDKLYVPIDQMDMLDKFSGAETPKKLSKIGGADFAKVKEKVKTSVKKLAFDLLALYAEREKKKGYVYSPDNELQIEFENSFPYTETEDQLISISEIKKDMENGKVMDRLLCGDVGFGKTEVALRVAFKAILAGKQVAFMAPTTILSEQHYNTAKIRMENFGAKIEVLNRFKTPKQVDDILNRLAKGEIDIICGTHRLLSKDVSFKDLGLIILDEEQKFGVEDKEKIKLKYPNVDVLTLSATPIPRTLHMSLSGIRDVSIISTPPSERLPVATFVTEQTDELIRDAIKKEMNRGGQTFVLFNSVEHIYAFADKIRKLVPDARVLVGHGQMPGKQLEDIIYQFYHGMADVLVCTTIIENGIDIENANTLIVIDSDRFGLSQLYQLRGRVGRGSKMAYAYLTYNPGKVLTEEAYKRLDAISEFTEFGSGFKLAMRDLEIRGSGNVLGAEQHGHMQKVGYELYSKLLAQAVQELKGEKVEEKQDVLVKISLDAFIPDTYMTKSEDRMVAYKTIASITSVDEKERVIRDFENTFGKIPQPTLNLIDIALVKAKAGRLKAKEIVSTATSLEIIFDDKNKIIDNAEIGELLYKFRMRCNLDFSSAPKICFKTGDTAEQNFKLLKDFLAGV